MFKKYCLASILAVAGLIAGNQSAYANECGDVSIASMNWASAEVLAEIDKLIFSVAFGCTVELTAGDALPLLEAMRETGKPDLVPELWEDSVRTELDKETQRGEVQILVDVLSDGAEEGFWIPRYIADAHPQIKTLAHALDRPDLFTSIEDDEDADDSEEQTDSLAGVMYNCPPGWACHIAASNLFRAFDGEEKGFNLVDTGSAAGLDASIAKAYKSAAGWLGYYWSPTAMLGRYEMVKLDTGAHEEGQWNACILDSDCADPAVNAWPTRRVVSVVSNDFSVRSGDLVDYVSKRQWSNETVSELLAWMAESQATGEEAAVHFLTNYEDVWTDWLPDNVVDQVKAAL